MSMSSLIWAITTLNDLRETCAAQLYSSTAEDNIDAIQIFIFLKFAL